MTQAVCAIVGFGTGVSLGVAKAFAQKGYALAVLARNPAKLADNARSLQDEGYTVQTITADAGDEASLVQAFAQVRAQLGDPEVLVYNAAMLQQDSIMSLTADALVQAFKVDAIGAVIAIQQVIPAMQKQRRGTILLTGGGLALAPSSQFISLGIGKAAIRYLAMSVAEAVKSEGIHVATVTICGTVAPGTKFDPDAIAQVYWQLHAQASDDWQTEYVYQ